MEDLVDVAKPGDDVRLVGEVIQKWKPLYPDERCDLETMMFANHVQVNNETMKGFLDNTDERTNEFQEFWTTHQNNPFVGIARTNRSFHFIPSLIRIR